MAIVRITTVQPEVEHRTEVTQIFAAMNEFFAKQPGCVLAMSFASRDGSSIGRIGVWDSEHDADAVAQMTHTMALRSRIIELLGHHQGEDRDEVLYNVTSSTKGL
ncbi:MAG: hypothetical protein O3B84_02575 [Chloroflexi bacterium]|nr:hypothetical protein [Chloroflexota bacterium]